MELLNNFIDWCSANPQLVAGIVTAAGAVSLLLETFLLKLKKKFEDFARQPAFKKLAFTLLNVFTILTTLATYCLANVPAHNLLPIYAALTIVAQFWHRFVISGLFTKIVVPFLEWQAGQKPATPVSVEPVLAPLPELE